jgi:hypothetical protein
MYLNASANTFFYSSANSNTFQMYLEVHSIDHSNIFLVGGFYLYFSGNTDRYTIHVSSKVNGTGDSN